MSETVRILSIDGGGVRGVIPAVLLARLEKLAGRPIAEMFDLVAGTSTGGILALGLNVPDDNGRPRYSPEALLQLYEEHGRTIFSVPSWRLPGFGARYPARGIERVLLRYFGDCRLKQSVSDVLITSYEIERRFPFLFRSASARQSEEYDFLMRDVARATSAAPTYFPPCKIETDGDYYSLIDGAMYANNPAMCALVEAKKLHPGARRIVVASFGTGNLTRRIPYHKARRWGLARWAKPVLEILIDGVSATVDYQTRRLLDNHYFRFQPQLPPENQSMDCASPENLRDLRMIAEAYARDHEDDLIALSTLLA